MADGARWALAETRGWQLYGAYFSDGITGYQREALGPVATMLLLVPATPSFTVDGDSADFFAGLAQVDPEDI